MPKRLSSDRSLHARRRRVLAKAALPSTRRVRYTLEVCGLAISAAVSSESPVFVDVLTTTSVSTFVTPAFFMPSSSAAAPDRSMTRFFGTGPRSLTVTITLLIVLRIDDPDLRAERQRAVRGGQCVGVVLLAAGRPAPAEVPRVVRRVASLLAVGRGRCRRRVMRPRLARRGRVLGDADLRAQHQQLRDAGGTEDVRAAGTSRAHRGSPCRPGDRPVGMQRCMVVRPVPAWTRCP